MDSINEILEAIKARRINRIITDSRVTVAGKRTLFAALRTDVNDGHRYIPEMYSRGVRTFLVDAKADLGYIKKKCRSAFLLVVDDVLLTLGELASRMNTGSCRVIVTGSTLKTEVKESLYRGLKDAGFNVFRSPRSFNSYLGVCLSVFENYFAGGSDIQIFEIGIDGPGQAEPLRRIIRPAVGVVTDITDEHDENFESHQAKVAEKEKLVEGTLTVSEAFPEVKLPVIEPGSLRTGIVEGVRNNTLIIDNFTPDAFSLGSALELLNRHSSPHRALVLALGTVSDYKPSKLSGYRVDKVIELSERVSPQSAQEAADEISDSDILVFGGHTEALDVFVSSLEKADHDTNLVVDLDALVHNFNSYRRMVPPGTGMVCMVKASGYGAGAIEVAKALQEAGASYLAVAVVDEGVQMRSSGITMPIMVMNPISRHYEALFSNRLEPAVFSPYELERLIFEARKAGIKHYPVHIKIDTGMHRVGFGTDDLSHLVEMLRSQDNVYVASVFSHLATADCLDKDDHTQLQIKRFKQSVNYLEEQLEYGFRTHLLNTAGMMRYDYLNNLSEEKGYGSLDFDMARLGIGLYGISPLDGTDDRLQPVATLRTSVISVKRYPAGTCVGYGCKGVTAHDAVIATLPIGYADGLDRRLGNGASSFLVNGVECPTIGNICMDMCMLDVTAAPDVCVGTPVEIFGESMPIERLAFTLGTIPYEILTSVGPRVLRSYIK